MNIHTQRALPWVHMRLHAPCAHFSFLHSPVPEWVSVADVFHTTWENHDMPANTEDLVRCG